MKQIYGAREFEKLRFPIVIAELRRDGNPRSVFHKDISFRLEKLDNQRLGIGLFGRFRRHKEGTFRFVNAGITGLFHSQIFRGAFIYLPVEPDFKEPVLLFELRPNHDHQQQCCGNRRQDHFH